jgi:hypothetical protein
MKDISIRLVGFMFFLVLGFVFYQTVIQKENEKKNYPYKLKIFYPTAEGIREGTEVSILGIQVGVVKSIREVSVSKIPDKRYLREYSDKAVEILLLINQPVTLWENYKVNFKSKTVFSGRTIDIDPGDFKGESNSRFQPTFSYDEKNSPYSISARYYDDFFSASYVLLDENKKDLRQIVRNLREISEKLKSEKAGTLPKLLNSEEVYDNLDDTVNDVSVLTAEARRYLEMQREIDSSLTPFSMSIIFNLFNLNLLSN